MRKTKKLKLAMLAATLTLTGVAATSPINTNAAAKPAQPKVSLSKSFINNDNAGLIFKWKSVKKADGYQYRYNLKYKKGCKASSYKVKTVKKTSAKINFLTHKAIAFQVRAFINTDGKKVYGKWSKALTYTSNEVENMVDEAYATLEQKTASDALSKKLKNLLAADEKEYGKGGCPYYFADLDNNGFEDLIYMKGMVMPETTFYHYDFGKGKVVPFKLEDGSSVFQGIDEMKSDPEYHKDGARLYIAYRFTDGPDYKGIVYRFNDESKMVIETTYECKTIDGTDATAVYTINGNTVSKEELTEKTNYLVDWPDPITGSVG
ncbi:MAG: hypothetical protein K6F00_09525 [Lachnospiraceae bacterium]|nr:hypothetical protein [Lachnospiraceae bacterium]